MRLLLAFAVLLALLNLSGAAVAGPLRGEAEPPEILFEVETSCMQRAEKQPHEARPHQPASAEPAPEPLLDLEFLGATRVSSNTELIVEDAYDEVHEDPSDRPNHDLGIPRSPAEFAAVAPRREGRRLPFFRRSLPDARP